MATDNQIAVKKRLIYAEDLFEPVDVNVLVVSKGGRSGGKTMASYEQLFRKRVEMAPTIDAVEVVRCKDCKSWNREDESGGMCTVDVAPVDTEIEGVWRLPCDFCSYGERRDDHAAD